MLKINKATWGFNANRIDVTNIVNEYLKEEGLQPMVVSHTVLGDLDGFHGIAKDLELQYAYDGNSKHIVVQEQVGGNIRILIITHGVPATTNTINTHGTGLLLH